MQDETLRYLRLGMLQFDEEADPAFLHRTERTKFAKKGNGYSVELMHPAWFVPPMSIEVTSRVSCRQICHQTDRCESSAE